MRVLVTTLGLVTVTVSVTLSETLLLVTVTRWQATATHTDTVTLTATESVSDWLSTWSNHFNLSTNSHDSTMPLALLTVTLTSRQVTAEAHTLSVSSRVLQRPMRAQRAVSDSVTVYCNCVMTVYCNCVMTVTLTQSHTDTASQTAHSHMLNEVFIEKATLFISWHRSVYLRSSHNTSMQ